jgi:hypothetical protein
MTRREEMYEGKKIHDMWAFEMVDIEHVTCRWTLNGLEKFSDPSNSCFRNVR